MGIGTPIPRLSWLLDDPRDGAIQSGYEILAASDDTRLKQDEGDLWDTGRVASRETAHIAYSGHPLGSRQRVWWKVRTLDAAGDPSPWSAPARWEMGLLRPDDWKACWVGSPLHGTPDSPAVVPALRRSFDVGRPFVAARIYVTALGLYALELNGTRVGDRQLAPGWTDYRHRVRYQVYDVGALLVEGSNTLEALLGDGWYCGTVGLATREQYGDRPRLLAQLEITRADGTRDTIVTDGSWTWRRSPILASDLLMGETYDARQERGEGAREAEFDAGGEPVRVFDDPGIALDADPSPPVRAIGEIAPIGAPTQQRGRLGQPSFIYDLGQNMVGRVRIRVRGERGTCITLRHAEMLDSGGGLYTRNLGRAAQRDSYTLRGSAEAETWEPLFTFHGFRYVEISGVLTESAIEAVTGVVLHSDLRQTGAFSCSDARVEQLQRNICWSQRGNFVDVPTDCPQRDERLGWTGDAQVFVATAAFNMDVAGFFAKYGQDLADAQLADGRVPPVAPLPPAGAIRLPDGGPAWSDAIVICPWTIYRHYGDTRILEDRYPNMVAFIDELERRFPHLIRSDPAIDGWGGFGDWLATDAPGTGDPRFGTTPKDLIGTAFLCHSASLLSRIADVLGRDSDRDRMRDLADRVRQAFRRRFVTAEGRVAGDTQTAYVLALHFDLLEGHERGLALEALVRDITSRDGHLSTGFVGTPYLLPVLTAGDQLPLAYRLLFQTSCPSWLYPVTAGATTIWERWDGWTEKSGFQDESMNSFNHYAYGAVGEWLYGTVAGLGLAPELTPERNAYRHAIIAPRPPIGNGFADPPLLTGASARLDSIHGRFETAWTLDSGRFELDVRVPPGCTARVRLPDGSSSEESGAEASTSEIGSGRHRYAIALR